MPIKTPVDIIADACQAVYSYRAPQVGTAEHIIEALDQAGYEIVRKPEPRERVVRTFTRPDGSTVEATAIPGGASGPDPRLGTVALLTPEGERIVNAIATGDTYGLGNRDIAAFADLRAKVDNLVVGFVQRPLGPEDFTGPVTLEPGKLDEAHQGHTRGLDVPATSPWILVEVTPGQLSARPVISDRKGYPDTLIEASATAVVTRQDGSRREFQASARRNLRPGGSFRDDAGLVLDEAIEMAAALGEAFIESCEALTSQTEEAA